MQVRQAREQYVRWLLVTRDLSPHTIRAYDADITALERHLGTRTSVRVLDQHRLLTFIEEQREAGLSSRSIKRLLDADPWLGTTATIRVDHVQMAGRRPARPEPPCRGEVSRVRVLSAEAIVRRNLPLDIPPAVPRRG